MASFLILLERIEFCFIWNNEIKDEGDKKFISEWYYKIQGNETLNITQEVKDRVNKIYESIPR
jgi:hypothetical protein